MESSHTTERVRKQLSSAADMLVTLGLLDGWDGIGFMMDAAAVGGWVASRVGPLIRWNFCVEFFFRQDLS